MSWLRVAQLTWLAVAACSSAPPPGRSPKPVSSAMPIDPSASLAIEVEEVTFASGPNTVPGTLVRPAAPGPRRAVVLMAGSGPTDRDWNNPLLPGENGSGKLLAEALARRGVVVLRFDKASVGANTTSLKDRTFDVYRDEGRAALAYLRTRPDVARDKLFVAGHSEGGIHATRVALEEGSALAGLVLLSASARSMQTLVLAQIEAQLRAALPDRADAELASLRAAFDDFAAGRPVDAAKASSLPPLQMLVRSITNPATATLARSMFSWDPLPAVAGVRVPMFVYNGRRDIQVDPDLDAKPLAGANARAELFIAADADHVLKYETRTVAELRANLLVVQSQMNAANRTLDMGTVDAITAWLAKH